MIRFKHLFTLGVLALSLGSVKALPPSNYEITGTTDGGGNVVVGSGVSLSSIYSGGGFLTNTGFDTLTFNPGSVANDFQGIGATVYFTTEGNLVTNHGIILSGDFGSDSPFTSSAVAFFTEGSQTGNSVVNFGTISADDDNGANEIVSTAISFIAGNGVFDASVINTGGTISGGSSSGNGFIIGSGIVIFDFDENFADVDGVLITNTGGIYGGNFNNDAEVSIGTSILIAGFGNVQNVTVNNSSTGFIIGGDGNGGEGVEEEGLITNFAGNGIVIANAIPQVQIEAPVSNGFVNNVDIFNAGLISGGNNNGYAMFIGTGIVIASGQAVNDVTITNTLSGSILGGNGGSTDIEDVFGPDVIQSVGDGINISTAFSFFPTIDEVDIEELFGVSNISISNGGLIGGGSENEVLGTSGGNGIAIVGLSGVFNVSLNNSGTVSGGDDNTDGYLLGSGVSIASFNFVSDVSITNTITGKIIGGSENGNNFEFFQGVSVGDGIAITINNGNVAGIQAFEELPLEPFSLQNITILNAGLVSGGDDNEVESNFLGGGGDGILIAGNFGLGNILIDNTGTITGGAFNHFAQFVGNGIAIGGEFLQNATINNHLGAVISGGFENYEGGFVGNGIVVFTEFGMDNVLINNNGLVTGGASDFVGGDGIALVSSEGTISNTIIFNSSTGIITGGEGINGEGSGDGGYGIYIAGGDNFENRAVEPGDLLPFVSNFNIINYGLIAGGSATGEGNEGGIGIDVEYPGNEQSTIYNLTGLITGGSSQFGSPGVGIQLGFREDGEGDITTNNVSIFNWATISSGAGVNGTAIDIHGSNNQLYLMGHSTVLGKITADGESNNILHVNFTGLSPADQAALTAFITAQGNTNDFTGNFTVRGVKYDLDPMVIIINTSSYQLQGITPNQKSIGANLDSMLVNPTGDLLTLVNAIDQGGNVPYALEQLSPQKYQIYNDIALSNANALTLDIDHRLNNLRDGSESIDTAGMGGPESTVLGFTKDSKDGKGTVTIDKVERHWGFFASGRYTQADVDGDIDLQDASFDTAGATLGVDGIINENWVVGALFDYQHTNAELDNQGSESDVDSYGGGLYAGFHHGGYYANGLLAYSHNDYDSRRTVLIPGFNRVANGSTSGDQFSANIDGGYDFKITDRLTVGPILGLQYVHVGVDSFSETGAGAANLAIGDQDVDSLRTRIGARADYHLQLNANTTFAVEARAEYQHEFMNDSQSITSAFIGSGLAPFTVQTSSPDRDAILAGVSLNATMKNRYTIFLDYDAQLGQSRYFEQSVKGGFKIKF